jgi:VWFA-related protein
VLSTRLGITVTALSLAALSGAQQIPTIRVPVRLVTVPALVFSKESRLIPGLRRTDFRVFDNGRLQTANLETTSAPVSVALAVQVNQDVRQYVPFIAKAGSAIEALLAGESGETAVITYGGEVAVVKPFDSGDIPSTLKKISANGAQARMIDAGLRAIALLKDRASLRSRVLLFIGQSMDSGSESALSTLKEQAERENVSIFALTLPEFGKAFVSGTFSLQGVGANEGGGFRAGVDLGRLISAVNRSNAVDKGADPFSILTAATGGTQVRFRKQRELEGAIAAVGVQLRSVYLLSYYPSSTETGYHNIHIEVDVPGAKAHSRPGYWFSAN